MQGLVGERVLMRIHIGEADKHDGKPLYHQIVELLRHEKLAGATVLRGISGFGPSNHVHTAHILSLSQDLPIVIEIVDSKEKIDELEKRPATPVTRATARHTPGSGAAALPGGDNTAGDFDIDQVLDGLDEKE